MINSGTGIIALLSGMLFNLSLSTLVAFAKVIQFLCLFALLSIPNYPDILNQIYNSQGIWNLNFYSWINFNSLECSTMKLDEYLGGNYFNHPSVQGTNFFCNSLPIFPDLIWALLIYFLGFTIRCKFFKQFYSKSPLNVITELISGCFIVFIVIIFMHINFVKLHRGYQKSLFWA